MPAGRKPLSIEELVGRLPGSPIAQERLRVILANIAGQIGVSEACAVLGIEESWFFALKHRSLQRWLEAPSRSPPGGGPRRRRHSSQSGSRRWKNGFVSWSWSSVRRSLRASWSRRAGPGGEGGEAGGEKSPSVRRRSRCAAAGPHGDDNAELRSIEDIDISSNRDLIIQSADDPSAAAASRGEARSGAVAAGAEVVAGSSLASPADASCSALGEDGSPSCVVAAGCARTPSVAADPAALWDVDRIDTCLLVGDELPADPGSAAERGPGRSRGSAAAPGASAADPRGRLRAAQRVRPGSPPLKRLRPLIFRRGPWRTGARFESDGLQERMRGPTAPVRIGGRRAAVTGFLEAHGPSLSLASLKAAYPDMTRAELRSLRIDYLARWGRAHGGALRAGVALSRKRMGDGLQPPTVPDRCLLRGDLERARSGEPPAVALAAGGTRGRGDGDRCLGQPFRDAWCALVLKCDNGPAFRAKATKGLLREWSIFGLYSPPYFARYNGACERANRTLKELTAHLADEAGRPGFWTSDDLLRARLAANRLSRPWGSTGRTPEETWTSRRTLPLDERAVLWQHLKRGIATACEQRGIDPTAALPHYTQAEIERIGAQPVLEALGLLHVTRRRIAPVI